MKELLNFVQNKMNELNIPYEFENWTAPVQYPYFVGSLTEFEDDREDGLEEKTLIITGTTTGDWLELIEVQETLKNAFPPVGGYRAILDSGSGVVLFYATALPIPTGEADLKRIEIRVTVKFWKVGY